MTNWGIMGTGKVAVLFAKGLSFLPDAKLIAVGSRNQATADKFAARFTIKKAYPSYEALVKDKDIDVIYIATPNTCHKENALLCLEHGKAVLCEKPFAINYKEAKAVQDLAENKKLFCMEAMWMRFVPAMDKLKEVIANGDLGEIREVRADFGILTKYDPKSRLYNPALGGGVLLDLGIYPLSFIFALLGKPAKVEAHADISPTGVDQSLGVKFEHANNCKSSLKASFVKKMKNEAVIIGTKGIIKIGPIYCPTKIKYLSSAKFSFFSFLKWKELTTNFQGNGYNYEAQEVMDCLNSGRTGSSGMPLLESVEIMEIMDNIRKQIGVRYPNEEA